MGGGRISPVLLIGLLIVFACCVVSYMLFLAPDGGDQDIGFVASTPTALVVSRPTEARAIPPTVTARPFLPPAPSTGDQTWLVMLYQDADDKILEEDIHLDLNEAERVGSTNRVHIVAQLDRYAAGFQGDGNWASAKRFYVGQDNDLGRIESQLVTDLGEVNMADGATLVDFCLWAIETFPADKHALILSDHGMGWPGGWSDPSPGGRGDPSIPLAAKLGDELYLNELDQALGEIRARSGVGQFELVGMDACLMGHLEVFSALAPHARYAVASQETEPALGWAYAAFLGDLARNPGMDGAELGKLIVDSYVQDDERIRDDQARADFLRQGSPMGGLFGLMGGPTAEQLVQQLGQGVTLSAVDLAAIPDLVDALNALAHSLQGVDPSAVAKARNYAQSFTSVFGREAPPSYLDLASWVGLLKRSADLGAAAPLADRVLAAIGRAVVAEKHGPKKPGASGISIYFPNSQLYRSPLTGPQSYVAIADRFARASLWDEFLGFHYAGRRFEATAGELVAPPAGETVVAPGAGQVNATPLRLSSRVASPGSPILLSTDVRGRNIGHIYLLVGFFDRDSNSIFVADMDYLESEESREVDGVYYPVWPDGGEFTLEFEWEPILFAIDDGSQSVVARFKPESYGQSFESAVYSVDGVYAFADGGETRYARLYFRDGYLRNVYGFTQDGGDGAPREIVPQRGDSFTILEQWLDLDARGQVEQAVSQAGGTLVFGAQMFSWRELDAAAGEYVLGFAVEDLDGAKVEIFEQIEVR